MLKKATSVLNWSSQGPELSNNLPRTRSAFFSNTVDVIVQHEGAEGVFSIDPFTSTQQLRRLVSNHFGCPVLLRHSSGNVVSHSYALQFLVYESLLAGKNEALTFTTVDPKCGLTKEHVDNVSHVFEFDSEESFPEDLRLALTCIHNSLLFAPTFVFFVVQIGFPIQSLHKYFTQMLDCPFIITTSYDRFSTNNGVVSEPNSVGVFAIHDRHSNHSVELRDLSAGIDEGLTLTDTLITTAQRSRVSISEPPEFVMVFSTEGVEEAGIAALRQVYGNSVQVFGATVASSNSGVGFIANQKGFTYDGIIFAPMWPSNPIMKFFSVPFSPTSITGKVTRFGESLKIIEEIDGMPAAIVFNRWAAQRFRNLVESLDIESNELKVIDVVHEAAYFPLGEFLMPSEVGEDYYRIYAVGGIRTDGALILMKEIPLDSLDGEGNIVLTSMVSHPFTIFSKIESFSQNLISCGDSDGGLLFVNLAINQGLDAYQNDIFNMLLQQAIDSSFVMIHSLAEFSTEVLTNPKPLNSSSSDVFSNMVNTSMNSQTLMIQPVGGQNTLLTRSTTSSLCFMSFSHDTQPSVPYGDVCILFAKLDGGALLWTRHADIMDYVASMYCDVFRQALQHHVFGGYEVKVEGETFMVAFSNPARAIDFAIYVQTALLLAPWHDKLLNQPRYGEMYDDQRRLIWRGPRIKMGLSFGNPKVKLNTVNRRLDFFGTDVNLAARISSLAEGGQILVSKSVTQWVQNNIDMETPVTEYSINLLGAFKLKGFKTSKNVFSVVPDIFTGRRFTNSTISKSETMPTLLLAYQPKAQSEFFDNFLMDSDVEEVLSEEEFSDSFFDKSL
ncbi:hypothetical protein PCE1_002707 [Barthelona sp. PCE]